MTLPRQAALNKQWRTLPPMSVQLARLARYIGVPDLREVSVTRDPHKVVAEARSLGLPVANELPDDPLLGFLDDNIKLGEGLKRNG